MTVFTWQNKSSFLFGGIDMYQRFGISLADNGMPEDVLMPSLRPRTVTIPLQSGEYDYGAKYYDMRSVQIPCVTVKAGSRDDAREMAYILSKKRQIRFWHEPEKYYVGRVYTAPGLDVLRNVGNRFILDLRMEPFAYRNTITDNFSGNQYIPNYEGTAPTPTYIIIENVGAFNAVNIRITQIERKDD